MLLQVMNFSKQYRKWIFNLKKIIMGGSICIITIIFLIICFNLLKENKQLKATNNDLNIEKEILTNNLESYDLLNSITVDNFEDRVTNKQDLFVYVSNSECSDCSTFSKTLKHEIESSNIKNNLYLVNIQKLHQDKENWLKFKRKYNIHQTPAFLLFEEGKLKSMIEWDEKKGLSSEAFHKWLDMNHPFIVTLK